MRGALALVCGCICALVCGMPLHTADIEHGDSSSPLQDGPESLGAAWNGELHRLLLASEDDGSSEEAGSGNDSPAKTASLRPAAGVGTAPSSSDS
jgi:hypothetical protein